MSTASETVRTFFEGYARSRTTLDIGLIDSQYPDSVLFAGPNGVRVLDKETVLASVPKGQEFLKAHGHVLTSVVSLDEARWDDRYAQVSARFLWRFEKEPSRTIDVELASTFILYSEGGPPRIVFQYEREDFQQALRARGVLAAS